MVQVGRKLTEFLRGLQRPSVCPSDPGTPFSTEALRGGSPMRTVYYVAEEDPTKAQAIIAKIVAPNEKVEAYGLLPEAAVVARGLKAGEFRSV
jgi:hypothetical protein